MNSFPRHRIVCGQPAMDWINDWEEPDADVAYEPAAYVNRYVRREPAAIAMTTQVTTKVPLSYDGKTSWFSYEDAIDDWCDITELEDEKRGPVVRNRLEGEAAVYKRILDRDALKANDPPGAGVEYFKRVLRPYFVKGLTNVFLYRFMQFVRFNRRSADMMKWMTRFQILLQRLMSSWMDMLEPVTQAHPQVLAYLDAGRCSVDWSSTNGRKDSGNHADHQWQYEDFSSERISSRRKSDCLTHAVTYRFVSGPAKHFDFIDDSSWQGPAAIHYNRVENSVHRNVLHDKDFSRQSFDAANRCGGRRSFLVLDEGELDGTFGYWAEDEEDGTEGFLDALDDVFWVYDDQNFSWFQRRFQGRRARKGKGKGRRKGKGKGRSGRRFFRPRGKGKGKRRGKGHFADEQQTT